MARDHCKIHLARLRRGSGTQPCTECGKGVKNRFRLCLDCGYHKAQIRAWQRGRAFMVEFKRLAAIEIFISRFFLSVIYTHFELWYHKAQIRAWQRGHRASSLNVWRLSDYFHLEVFISCIYPSHYGRPYRRNSCRTRRPSPRGSTIQ